MTSAAVVDNFAAKVLGLAQMIELWPLRPDVRTLLCSSVMGVWGGHGVVAYSAANRLLDVMAAQLRAQGRHCVAVKWGLWQAPRPANQLGESRMRLRSPASSGLDSARWRPSRRSRRACTNSLSTR